MASKRTIWWFHAKLSEKETVEPKWIALQVRLRECGNTRCPLNGQGRLYACASSRVVWCLHPNSRTRLSVPSNAGKHTINPLFSCQIFPPQNLPRGSCKAFSTFPPPRVSFFPDRFVTGVFTAHIHGVLTPSLLTSDLAVHALES